MNKIFCAYISGDIVIDAIKSLQQIYRFDDIEICAISHSNTILFSVPSTEWLEEFTKTIKQRPENTDIMLLHSGYKYLATTSDDTINVRVYDSIRDELTWLELDQPEAELLHHTVLSSILCQFLRQGGDLRQLDDLGDFRL